MPFVRACAAFVIGINNAIVQELATLYMQGSYNLRMVVAGSQDSREFLKNAYIRVCTWLNRVY